MRARNELLVEYFSLLVLIPIAVETEYVTGSLEQYLSDIFAKRAYLILTLKRNRL